jgi:hypothetical protein
MRFFILIVPILLAFLVNESVASQSDDVNLPKRSFAIGRWGWRPVRSLATGRWGLRPGGRQLRSLASGRWGLRPGKRSMISYDMETPIIDDYPEYLDNDLNTRPRRNLATGRWGKFRLKKPI